MSTKLAAIVAASSAASFYLGLQLERKQPGKLLPFISVAESATSSAPVLVGTQQATIMSHGTEYGKAGGEILPSGVTTTLKEETSFWAKGVSRASEIMKHGYPGFDNLRTYEDFVVSYDRRTRTAHWVMEHLTPDRMVYNPDVDRSKSIFQPDMSIHPYFRSTNEDYFRSGYDRGHLAPAADHRRSQRSIDQTFFLTNMSPQVGKGFNRDKWNDLEKYMRHRAKECRNIWICTGPVYLPRGEADGNLYVKYKVIGANRVAVPTHFFKVALIEREQGVFELESYLLPNEAIPDAKPLSDFLIPLADIERAAGFLMFERVPQNMLTKINGQMMQVGASKRLFGLL